LKKYKKRIHKILKAIHRKNIDTLMVLIAENRRYLSGFTGEDTQFDESAGALFISDKKCVLATDSRYEEQAKIEAGEYEIICYKEGLSGEIATILKSLGTKKLGYESHRISVAQMDKFKEKLSNDKIRISLIPTENIVENLRLIKDEWEIDETRKALTVAESAFLKFVLVVQAGKTEKEVYDQVGLPYIEPELRENRGEVEAAQKDELPNLLTLKDLRGDLHSHTKATDGHHSLEAMAKAAKEHGYEYLAVTDHSQKVTMAKGLDAKRLSEQIKAIDRLNEELEGIRILKGIEVDILEDGSLDLPDDILKELDLRVCSVHYKQNLSQQKQTERIIRAMDNPYFNILAHPTGRLINERKPMELNLEKIMEAAKDRGCHLEVNAHPDRLDLSDPYCKMAREMDLKLAISTDAHSTSDLDFMRFGVNQARRGWLEAGDVLNTHSWKQLKKLLKRK